MEGLVATHTQLETGADVSRDASPRTRWAAVLESGFVTGSQPGAIGSQPAATGEPRRSRWATVLASKFVDAPLPASR